MNPAQNLPLVLKILSVYSVSCPLPAQEKTAVCIGSFRGGMFDNDKSLNVATLPWYTNKLKQTRTMMTNNVCEY